MQRLMTMVHHNWSWSCSYIVPVRHTSHHFPVTLLHRKLLHRPHHVTVLSSSQSPSYGRHAARKLHCSCCQETNATRQPGQVGDLFYISRNKLCIVVRCICRLMCRSSKRRVTQVTVNVMSHNGP